MFSEGMIFVNDYPKEAADWCNDNEHHIEDYEPDENGSRRFIIVRNSPPTKEELIKREMIRATSLEARIAALEDYVASMEV